MWIILYKIINNVNNRNNETNNSDWTLQTVSKLNCLHCLSKCQNRMLHFLQLVLQWATHPMALLLVPLVKERVKGFVQVITPGSSGHHTRQIAPNAVVHLKSWGCRAILLRSPFPPGDDALHQPIKMARESNALNDDGFIFLSYCCISSSNN